MIEFYNSQRKGFKDILKVDPKMKVSTYVNFNPKLISWTESLLNSVKTNKNIEIEYNSLVSVNYRPFQKSHLYFNRSLNERVYQFPKLFPTGKESNIIICVQGAGDKKKFSVLISNKITDLGFNGACQCFPLYYYEENKNAQKGLFDQNTDQDYVKRDAISNFILDIAVKQFGKNVTKEDIFYYVYGFLHSPEYRETFANDLKKMLPKLPLVDEPKVFWQFSKAGRELADLHLNYEKVPPSSEVVVTGAEKLSFIDEEPKDTKLFIVDKMRFPKKNQKDTILYNGKITISNIPLDAYDYVVNGKPAIEWIMERYQVSTHKDSGIVNDPNDWAKESENPRYILDLILSIITVSIKTNEIVSSLPKVKFD